MAGRRVIPTFGPEQVRAVISDVLGSTSWEALRSALRLSARETEILRCILNGVESDPLVADRIQSTPRTVHTHVERLYRKLGVTTRAQLVTYVWA